MMFSKFPIPSAATFLLALLPIIGVATASEPVSIVLQNGRSLPITSVALEGDKLKITTASPGFNVGQLLPLASADHIYGTKPIEINQAVALILLDKPAVALKLLEPIVAGQQITSKIPGNFWLEAARASLVAHAMVGTAGKTTELGKEIADATPAPGIDPFASLAKAILLPTTTPVEQRELAFRDLTTNNLPADICAYAAFFRAKLLMSNERSSDPAQAKKQSSDALEALLTIPSVHPAGSIIVNAAAEILASDILVALGRRQESVALLNSAIRQSPGTALIAEANKRLESIK